MNTLKNISTFILLSVFTFSFAASTSFAQTKGKVEQPDTYKLKGKVVDAETGDPLTEVKVAIAGTDISKETNKKGKITFKKLPEGTHTLKVEEEGYQTWKKKINLNKDSKITIKVKPEK